MSDADSVKVAAGGLAVGEAATREVAAGPRLLVVDDEAVQRLVVARTAELAGFATDGAPTLAAAAYLLYCRSYDVVVLDLSLQEHDGIELLRSIADSESDPILIFISGFDGRVRQAAARLASALGLRVAGTLGKPLQLNSLTGLLRSIPERPTERQPLAFGKIESKDLERAIERDEILCMYQPKVDLADRRIVGLEVLTRWRSPVHGLVSPELFIPLAERNGLIDRMTLHILERSLTASAPWRQVQPDLTLAVNLSPVSLIDLALPERVSDVLAATGTAPGALVLEVTEGAVMADHVAAADILTRLRIRGVGVSIDDFGTGHSSLLSLLRLPFNEIKVDQSFVRLLPTDTEARKIVRAVMTLARELDVSVVAEGIETEAVATLVASLGGTIGQGFLFAPALRETAVLARLGAPAVAV